MNTDIFARFPAYDEQQLDAAIDQKNPAIRLYGRRFYKDQTPVEYLAELLLVFASAKSMGSGALVEQGKFGFSVSTTHSPCYFPEDRVALKLFSFFPSSKLETRHPIHHDAYKKATQMLGSKILSDEDIDQKEEAIRLLQGLFNGFVGVAKNRTWVTHSFLPASSVLLSREVSWQHPKALKDNSIKDWQDSKKYLADNFRNFMGRGGELLFLQLANLFTDINTAEITEMLALPAYAHIKNIDINQLKSVLENSLKQMLTENMASLGSLVTLIEDTLSEFTLNDPLKKSSLGWVPVCTKPEALLFATEMHNICDAKLNALEKVDLLQTLCSMHVLRSLCFQGRRIDEAESQTDGFMGNYAWVAADMEAGTDNPIRQMAEHSFVYIEELLYRALRSPRLYDNQNVLDPQSLKNGDDNTYRHFRKLSKELGLVIPRKGKGQRFTLHQGLLRFLVAALLKPNERVRLPEFYRRVFAHYGLALTGKELLIALQWSGSEVGHHAYAVSSNTTWIEEALQQGGFLIELSDAVSMVHNP